MKHTILLACAFFLMLSAAVTAQTSTWLQDYEKAANLAKTSGKFLLMDFSGSDWCPWCVKLDKEVFSQKPFQTYAKKNLVLFLADFPRKKELDKKIKNQNDKLAQKYEIDGFPTVILLNAKGELVGKTGYQQGGAEAYVKYLQEIIKKYKAEKINHPG